jgi:hypothetical protein
MIVRKERSDCWKNSLNILMPGSGHGAFIVTLERRGPFNRSH